MKLLNYVFNSYPSPDSVKFTALDNTINQRSDLTVTRKGATYNAATKAFSIPEYRITYRKDVLDSEGVLTGQRLTVDLTIRTPVNTVVTDLEALINSLKQVMGESDFLDYVIGQRFPCVPCDEENEG